MNAPASFTARVLLMAAAVAVAIWFGYVSYRVNLERSCLVDDWPKFEFCADVMPVDPVRAVPILRNRISRNPGDSSAYLTLALLAAKPGTLGGLNEAAVIQAARDLAGTQPKLLYLVADKAIQRQDWLQVVDVMVNLVEDRKDGLAAQTLARVIGAGVADAALRDHLKQSSTWLAPTIGQMPAAGVPMLKAMPLIVQALPLGLVTPDLALDVIRSLKAGGAWNDAYALWARMLNRPVDLIYNGGFEEAFIRDGFDWELKDIAPTRAGVLVAQPQTDGHGRVLELDFTGKTIEMPIIRQVTLLSGRYRFSGQFMSRKLRSSEGLTWIFSCVATAKEFARSAALSDTGGQWQSFSVELAVPSDCGPAVTVQLQTMATYEAVSGIKGLALFDNLKLSRQGDAS
jgi:hypothetical protein